MDHIKVLKRAWEITWRYRALWIFGIILALTTGTRGNNPQTTFGGNGEGGELIPPSGEFPIPEPLLMPSVSLIIAIAAALACVVLILIVASVIARYVSETALIRMVDDHEETGEMRSVREGFRLGWSRTALRLFLLDLLIGVPTAVAFIVLLALPVGIIVLSVLSIAGEFSVALGVIGIVAGTGLFLLLVLLAIVVFVALALLMHFFRRVCALEGLGVIDSIREGFGIVRRHWLDVGIMWIIMIGVGLAWMLVTIPVVLLLLFVAMVVAGLPALLLGGLASLILGSPAGWIVAGVVALPIFILVLATPLLFLGGLMEVFKSSVWTLTYREVRALEGLEAEPDTLPERDIE